MASSVVLTFRMPNVTVSGLVWLELLIERDTKSDFEEISSAPKIRSITGGLKSSEIRAVLTLRDSTQATPNPRPS